MRITVSSCLWRGSKDALQPTVTQLIHEEARENQSMFSLEIKLGENKTFISVLLLLTMIWLLPHVSTLASSLCTRAVQSIGNYLSRAHSETQ